eukprot:COSAG04_NODE_897_length_9581_cov_96.260599_7_plen_84_part_00
MFRLELVLVSTAWRRRGHSLAVGSGLCVGRKRAKTRGKWVKKGEKCQKRLAVERVACSDGCFACVWCSLTVWLNGKRRGVMAP